MSARPRILSIGRFLLVGLAFVAAAASAQTTLSANPSSVVVGSTVTAAWSGIPAPTVNDWIGLYALGTSDLAHLSWRYTDGAASSSVPFTIPTSSSPGNYELRFFNGGYARIATSNIFTVNGPNVTLTASPASVVGGGSVTAAWTGIVSPTATDWIGLYALGASNAAYLAWRYTNGAAASSVPLTVPTTVAPGTYELRLFSNNTANRLASSNIFAVYMVVASGTVTLGGSPLAGVAFAASNSGICEPSNASGQYSCAGPHGWSGSVTPSLSGYRFTPASRDYSAVTVVQTGQNYAATVVYEVSGTVNSGGSPVAGVAFAASGDGTCTASNGSGQYSCTVPQGWSGSVTPSLTSYVFAPASRNYTSVAGHQTTQDYAANSNHQLSGTVTAGGAPLAGVGFTASSGGTCTPSNASGQYSCTVAHDWSGTVTPSIAGYTFTPASRNHSNVTGPQTGHDFAATVDPNSVAIFYIQVDHLNTPRLVANQQGQTVWRWDQQDPFGANVPDENPSGLGVFEQPLRFPGQYADKETNLHYNFHRDYDSSLGRYIESDPKGLMDGPNTYAYVGSDPLRFYDQLAFGKTQGQASIAGNDPVVSGINKKSTPQQVQNAINEAKKVIDDPNTSAARKKFLRGWVKVAKRGFTKAFCPPFLEDIVQALAAQACLNGDLASCQLFINMGGEIIDPDSI